MPKITGNSVTVSSRPAGAEAKLARAKGRVENLTLKLARLTDGRHPESPALTTAIEETKLAIKRWQAEADVAQYKLDQKSGGAK